MDDQTEKTETKEETKAAPDHSKALAEMTARLQKLEANNQALLSEKMEAKELAEKAAQEAAKKGGDVEALEKSWAEKLARMEAEYNSKMSEYDGIVSALTVGQTATKVAAEVFGENADLMQHHIDKRLVNEVVDGKPHVRVLDNEGKPSAMTVEELAAEFKNSERFAPFVVGTKASGGGSHSKGGGSAQTKKFEQMSSGELSELRAKDQAAYDNLKAEYDKRKNAPK